MGICASQDRSQDLFFCSFVVYLISEREGGECCYAVLCCAVLYYGITYYSTQHNTHISDSQSPFLSDFQISDSDICVCVFFFFFGSQISDR